MRNPACVYMQAAQTELAELLWGNSQEAMKVGIGVVGRDIRGSKLIMYKSDKKCIKM